jgi:hypothetical protein
LPVSCGFAVQDNGAGGSGTADVISGLSPLASGDCMTNDAILDHVVMSGNAIVRDD